jgi:hypothetical protein
VRQLLLGSLPVQTPHRSLYVIQLTRLLLDHGEQVIQLRIQTGLATILLGHEIGELAAGLQLSSLALAAGSRDDDAFPLFRS